MILRKHVPEVGFESLKTMSALGLWFEMSAVSLLLQSPCLPAVMAPHSDGDGL